MLQRFKVIRETLNSYLDKLRKFMQTDISEIKDLLITAGKRKHKFIP